MVLLKVPVGRGDHSWGNKDAPVTLVEYGDYECPHCARAYGIVKRLEREFDRDLCFVFRNFPLTTLHPHAELAAEGAEAVAAQGKFWPMHDGLFEHQEELSLELIVELAEELGLNVPRFIDEVESHEYQAKIRSDFLGGVRSGVNGTPTFFINGVRHDADFEYETLSGAINLAKTEAA